MVRALVLALAFTLAACAIPREIDPRVIYEEVTGEIDAGRERPPGLDKPFPNLGTVPPRPAPPDPATRAAITRGLEANRSESRDALTPRAQPAAPSEAAPGTPPLPAAPPPPPSLARAVPVPWTPVPLPGAAGTSTPSGATAGTHTGVPEASPPAPEPGEVPAAPPPDLLAAPPPLPRID